MTHFPWRNVAEVLVSTRFRCCCFYVCTPFLLNLSICLSQSHSNPDYYFKDWPYSRVFFRTSTESLQIPRVWLSQNLMIKGRTPPNNKGTSRVVRRGPNHGDSENPTLVNPWFDKRPAEATTMIACRHIHVLTPKHGLQHYYMFVITGSALSLSEEIKFGGSTRADSYIEGRNLLRTKRRRPKISRPGRSDYANSYYCHFYKPTFRRLISSGSNLLGSCL